MALTPIDVQQKTFGTALRGYDLDEVDDFLDDVVTSLKSYEERLVESQERIAALQAELEGKGDSESAISRALVTAQRSADALLAEAQSDSDRIKTEAKAEADRMLAEASAERERLDAARAEEQERLDAELAAMHEKIAAIRAKVLDLNASIESNLVEMDATVAGEAPVEVPEEIAQPGAGGAVSDDEEPSSFALPVEDVSGETPSDESKWYETASEHADQELDFDLDVDDETAASVVAEGEGILSDAVTSDATVEMTAVGGTEPDGDSDALDEAIAEATFQASDEGQEPEPDDGWTPSEESAEEDAEDTSEPWEEVWGSEEDDRPRRPWE